jgi:hypothetical protein
MSVIFADPPSVVGIGGGQIVEGVPGAAAVVLADCVEVSSPSPGNSRGAWEVRDGALMPLALPLADPDIVTGPPIVALPVVLVAADPPAAPDDDDVEDVAIVDVGTPSGSDPTVVVPLPVTVWALAVVMPARMIAIRIVRCIAFSCF